MPTFEDVTGAESAWIGERLSDAVRLCAVSGVEGLTPELLDEA